MNADRLTLLRDSLEKRCERLKDCQGYHFPRMLRHLWQSLQSDPWLKGTLDELLRRTPTLKSTAGCIVGGMEPNEPQDAQQHLELQCHIWQYLAEEGPHDEGNRVKGLAERYYKDFVPHPREGKPVLTYDNMKAQLAQPVTDFLIEQLSEQSLLFGTLVRYRIRSEIYNRATLQGLYGKGKKDTEARLKADLHLYLHDQGIDFVIEPEMDKSKLDVLASPSGDKKVVEAKVFDDGHRTKAKVAQGITQTRGYARQHGVSRSYYVVYSMSQKHLVFEAPTVMPHLYEIRFSDGVVYALVVNIATPGKSVSKRTPEEAMVTRADLGL